MRYVILLMVLAVSVFLPHHFCSAQQNQQQLYQRSPSTQSYDKDLEERSKLQQDEEAISRSIPEVLLRDEREVSRESIQQGIKSDANANAVGQINQQALNQPSVDANQKPNVVRIADAQQQRQDFQKPPVVQLVDKQLNPVNPLYQQLPLQNQGNLQQNVQFVQHATQSNMIRADDTKFVQPLEDVGQKDANFVIQQQQPFMNSVSVVPIYRNGQVYQQAYAQQAIQTNYPVSLVTESLPQVVSVVNMNSMQQIASPLNNLNQINLDQFKQERYISPNQQIEKPGPLVIASNKVNPVQQMNSVAPRDANNVQIKNNPNSELVDNQIIQYSNLNSKMDVVRSASGPQVNYLKRTDVNLDSATSKANLKENLIQKAVVNMKDDKFKDLVNYRTHERRSLSARNNVPIKESRCKEVAAAKSLEDNSEFMQSPTVHKNTKLTEDNRSPSSQLQGHLKNQMNQRRSIHSQQQPVSQMKNRISLSNLNSGELKSSHNSQLKARQVNDFMGSNLMGPIIHSKQPEVALANDNHMAHKSLILDPESPFQQPLQLEEEMPLMHEALDSLYRPINRIQPAPKSVFDSAAFQRSVDQGPPPPPMGPDNGGGGGGPQPPGMPPPQLNQMPPQQQPPQPPPPSTPGEPSVCTAMNDKQRMSGTNHFEIAQVSYASVSPKQSQLHKLIQQLYQAEAQVQLEAQQIQQAQAVAAAAQQTLEEAANNVKVISAALQSAQESVASAAIRAHIAQLQLAAHDQMLFTARQNVDSLSAQMVGLQAEVGISYDVHHLNVPELLGRLQQPLSNEQTPTPIPTLIPLNVNPGADKPPSYVKLRDDSDFLNKRAGDPFTRSETDSKLHNLLPNDQFIVDPALVLNGLRTRYRDRRDLTMLLDELERPLEEYYRKYKK